MKRSLLAIALALATAFPAGCIIDRGPLVAVDADRSAHDAFVADLDADLDAPEELPDAWRMLEDDASLDAALEPDAWIDPIDAWSQPDTGDAPRCTPRCGDATTLIACAGDVESSETCPLGCGGTTPHCFRMVTSHLATHSIFGTATEDMTVATDTTIDTDTTTMGTLRTDGAVTVRVMVFGRIDIGANLRVVGSLPLVLIARDGITVGGSIDVSASGATPGPGGRAGASSSGGSAAGPGNGRGGAHDGDYDDGGGGGGGQCGAGGRGGQGGSAGGGAGGGPTDIAADLETPRGGGGGGAGNGAGARFGGGGGGAGAVQLSSQGSIVVGGRILARGAGGAGGTAGGGNDGAGGGGGAGGWILIEAPSVTVGGGLDASGGAGGGAQGGGGGGAGGAGASIGGGDGGGETSTFGNHNGGGGGGGAGCIVIRSHDPPTLPGTLSPSDPGALRTLPLILD